VGVEGKEAGAKEAGPRTHLLARIHAWRLGAQGRAGHNDAQSARLVLLYDNVVVGVGVGVGSPGGDLPVDVGVVNPVLPRLLRERVGAEVGAGGGGCIGQVGGGRG
jgi:hypothetical protein